MMRGDKLQDKYNTNDFKTSCQMLHPLTSFPFETPTCPYPFSKMFMVIFYIYLIYYI